MSDQEPIEIFYDHLVVRDGGYIDTDDSAAPEFMELVREALRTWHAVIGDSDE